MNITGLIKFLELLPFLQVVENHPKYKEKKPPQTCAFCKKEFDYPRQRKYCSTECRVDATKQRTTNDYTKVRICPTCENPMPLGRRSYCSDECQKEQTLANNRNPFSEHGTKSDEWSPLDHDSVPMHSLAPDILAEVEAYAEDHPYGIKEDMDELNQIIMEENRTRPATYKKDFRSPKESGKKYWSVKQIENYRREKAGLPQLATIKHSSLEQQLVKRHEGKKKNPVIAIREENYQIEKHTKGFTTIGYSPRTQSGKLKSEILADVERKKSMGST